jgi:hypothetical protein
MACASAAAVVVGLWQGPAMAEAPPADLAALEASLVSGESATAILGRWCADHALADPPRIVAIRDRSARVPAGPAIRRRLEAKAGEAVAYRRVSLACGGRVLSRADNWYLPSRLTPAMNKALETTDTPFGQVVRPLGFHRVTLHAERAPRPGTGRPILRLTAVLVAADGGPFSLVREAYLPALEP